MADFKAFDLNSLPKRTRGPKVDTEAAKALLAIIEKSGAASDQEKYPTAEKARAAGMRAVRMLSHVVPDGKRGAIRTFALDKGGFGYAVFIKDAAADDDAENGEEAAAE